jgi:hypothetical protein
MQLGDLGVLRGVAGGVAEEARTRGFPSPPFGGFGFVVVLVSAPFLITCSCHVLQKSLLFSIENL